MITRLVLGIAFLIASAAMFAHARKPSGKATGWRTPAVFFGIAGIGSLCLAAMMAFTGRE